MYNEHRSGNGSVKKLQRMFRIVFWDVKVKVKQSRYTPWRCFGGEEV
jgi:hypothetical protein